MTGKGDKAPGAEGSIVQLTDGPFHDYDPMELPDGMDPSMQDRVRTSRLLCSDDV